MADQFSYACKDFQEMKDCPFHVFTQTEEELWHQMELHARLAHGLDPSQWSDEDRLFLKSLIVHTRY